MGLIERILEKVLSDHVGDFLKVNREQLAASLMRGEVVLTGVELRVEALKEMMKMLPFCIKSASVKTLKAKVPWNELRSKSVRVHASGIQIVLTPQSIDENAAGDSWAEVVKRQRLKAAELLLNGMMEGEAEREAKKEMESAMHSYQQQQQQQGEEDDDFDVEDGGSSLPSSSSATSTATKKKSRMSLLQRLIARILDNLAITVDDLHIRYEDPNGFSLGLRLEEFSLFTVAENNEPAFVDRTIRPTPAILRRRVKIRGLAVYGEDQHQRRRRDLIRPFGIGVTISQHLVSNPTFQFSVDAKIEGKISLAIGPDEYSDVARVVERATAHDAFVTQTAILKRRPTTTPKADPIGWWKFAIHAVLTALRQNRQDDDTASVFSQNQHQTTPGKPATWPKILALIQQRWKYVLLYKRRLIQADSKFLSRARKHSAPSSSAAHQRTDSEGGGEELATPNLQRIGTMSMKGEVENQAEEQVANAMLRELEIELPFQSIMLFRAFAEAEFREEKARLRKLHRSKKIPARAISAVVHGATSGRKLVLRSLGFMKASTPSAGIASASSAAINTGGGLGEDDISWTLSAKERQELYESVAADPTTGWMIAKTTFATGATSKRIGYGPSFEASVGISTMSLTLFSSQVDPILEIRIADLKVKAENSGFIANNSNGGVMAKKNVAVSLWTVDASLGSADFLDLRPEVTRATANRDTVLQDHRYIPGGLKSTSATTTSSTTLSKPGAPLVQLQMGMTYLGGDRTKLKVVGEIRPTQLTVSIMLVERLLELPGRVQSLQTVAPTALGKIKALGEIARIGMRSTLKQTLDVRIDWDTPSLCIPISIETDGYARALELDLGKFRVRSSVDDTQLDFEAHGVKSSIRLLEKVPDGSAWVLVKEELSHGTAFSKQFRQQLDHTLLEKFNLEVRFRLSTMALEVETTPILLRIDENHLGAIGMAASDALDLLDKVGPSADTYRGMVVQATAAAKRTSPIAVSVKVPKLDIQMTVPYRHHELRRKRPGWGDVGRHGGGEASLSATGDLLPEFGWLKLRILNFALVQAENSEMMHVSVDLVHVRDDVQRAGEAFRDLFKIDGKTLITIRASRDVVINVNDDITFSWNPSTMDALGFFIKRTVLDPLRKHKSELLSAAADVIAAVSVSSNKTIIAPPGARRGSSLSAGTPKKTVSVSLSKTFRMFLNQETIGTRFGVVRVENLRIGVENSSKIDVKLHNLSLYGLQWEPLTSVRGMQLFGSELIEENSRPDDIISVMVDTEAKTVDLLVNRGRFLWAHTFTKQFADYFSDGVGAVLARHFSPPVVDDLNDRSDNPPPRLEMLVKGRVVNTTLVCPALRFGEQFRYSPTRTDEFVAFVHEATLEVSVFDKNERRNHLNGLFREDDAAGCGTDATKTLNAEGAKGDGLVQQDPAVEIRIQCLGLDLKSVKKSDEDQPLVAEICKGIKGGLAWHILDFTRAQRLARALCSPLTAREQARLEFDKKTLGEFGIPYGEHPHGVSPQKFEMIVDVDPDTAKFQMSPTDLHLMFLIIFENILDHRRRLARTAPPRLPLFENDEFTDWGDELVSGPDELLGGNFGLVAVKNSRFELLPHEMTPEHLAHDLQGFSGRSDGPPAIVDLDLSMKMPKFSIALVTPVTRKAFAELNVSNFEMALSEFYDRTQFIEISVDQFNVTSPGPNRTVVLDVRPSSFLKNPSNLRVRGPVSFKDHRTDWNYVRTSKSLYVFVNKFPQKDRRVELGLERLEMTMDNRFVERLHSLIADDDELLNSIKDAQDRERLKLPNYPGGPRRVPRALGLELFCNRFIVRAVSSPVAKGIPPDQVLLKGCAHVVVAVNRSNAVRGQVQLVTGVALRALSDDLEPQQGNEEIASLMNKSNNSVHEDSLLLDSSSVDTSSRSSPTMMLGDRIPDPEDFERLFRFWLEDVYMRKNPLKLGEVDSILRTFSGNESELIQSVCKKYNEEPFDFTKFRRLHLAKTASLVNPASATTPGKKRPSLGSTATTPVSSPRSPVGFFTGPTATAAATASSSNSHSNQQYLEVTIVEPFGIRIDINQDASKSDLVVLVEPIKGKLTNGHLEGCRNVMKHNDFLTTISNSSSTTTRKTKMKRRDASVTETPALAITKKPLSVTVLVHGIEFNLINDYGSSHSFPLLRASLSGLALKVTQSLNGGTAMTVNVTAASRPVSMAEAGLPVARVDYFNPRLLAWEPLVEPWEFDLAVRDWCHIDFRSRRPLNVNLTYSFVESCAYWLACRSARSRGRLLAASIHSEHYIINETGLPLIFWAQGNEQHSVKLDTGQRAPLRFSAKVRAASSLESSASNGPSHKAHFYRDTREGLRVGEDEAASMSKPSNLPFGSPQLSMPGKMRNVAISLRFLHENSDEEFGRLLRVPIDSFGTLVYGLNRPAVKVTVHVSLEHGSKVVRILSPVQFRNITSRPLSLLLTSTVNREKQWALGPISNDKVTYPIPLDRLQCEVRYRPVTPLVNRSYSVPAAQQQQANQHDARTELEAEAAGAISKASDENGYGWSTTAVSLLELHHIVDRPVSLVCDRAKSFSRAEKRSGTTYYEQEAGSFKGGGVGYRFATFWGVESFESSDELGLRETYVVTISPLLRIENRLPCPLLVRSIRREIMVNAGEPADLPVSGGKVLMGEEIDIQHVGSSERRRRSSLNRSTMSNSAPMTPDKPSAPQQQQRSNPEVFATGGGGQAAASITATTLTPSYVLARDVWLMLAIPGFTWSVPFQPASQASRQSVVVSPPFNGPQQPFVRLMMDCEQLVTGCLRVSVFVESWFINDARKLVGLQYRESGVGGEQLIYEVGSKFKDRGGQAANLIYELGQNLKLKTMLRGGSGATPSKADEQSTSSLTALSSSSAAQKQPLMMNEEEKSPSPLSPPSPSLLSQQQQQSLHKTRNEDEDEDEEDVDVGLFSEGRNVCVRFLLGTGSYWSAPVSLDTVGQHTDVMCSVEMEDPSSSFVVGGAVLKTKRFFTGLLGMSVKTAPSAFRRSRIVTFCPRFVFVNGMQSMKRKSKARSDAKSSPTKKPLKESAADDVVLCFSSLKNPSLEDPLATCWVETINAMVLFDPSSLVSSTAYAEVNQSGSRTELGKDPSPSSSFAEITGSEESSKRVSPILRMAMRKNNEWWGWSGPFCCSDSGGEFSLKLRNLQSGNVCVLRVRFEQRDASTIVLVEEESPVFPLYRIVNQTDEPVHYFQPLGDPAAASAPSSGSSTAVGNERGVVERLLTRGSSNVFGWDEPNNVTNRVVRLGFRGDTHFHDAKIDELSAPHVVHLPGSRNKPGKSVWVSVRIRGITKTLIITDRPPPLRIRNVSQSAVGGASSAGASRSGASSSGSGRISPTAGHHLGSTAHDYVLQRRADDADEVELTGASSNTATTGSVESLFSFRVELAQVGLSIIDRAPQELLYISLTDMLVDYARTNPPQQRLVWQEEDEEEQDVNDESRSVRTMREGVDAFDLSVRRVQIDSQLAEAEFPVMLGPAKSWFAMDESVRPLMLRLSLVRRFPANAALQRFDFYEFASLQLYEMDVKVEDALLLLLGRMAWECAMSLRSEEELVSGRVDSEIEGAYARLQRWMDTTSSSSSSAAATDPNSKKLSIKAWLNSRPTRSLKVLTETLDLQQSSLDERKKIYFGLLHILPLHANLSFRFTAHDPKSLLSLSRFKTALALRGDQVGIGQPAMFDAEYVAKSLPPALINIDNAKIRLLPLFAPHVLAEKRSLFKTVLRHYSQQAITQVYRILGSSDLMGNPLGVVSDLGTGLNDFISHPISGLSKASPTEFVKGLGRGTFSLLRHVTLGTFDALSKVTGALGAGVALLSLDHRFVAERWSTLRFEQPRTAGTGLALGVKAFANSLYDGAGGLVVRPLRSVAEEGSAQAFARALGLGLVGVVVKPVVGLLDFTSRASSGVIASVQSFDPDTVVGWNRQAERVRLPRAFKGLERRLDPYLQEDAFVSYMIKLLEPSVHHLFASSETTTTTTSAAASASTIQQQQQQQHFDYQTHVALDGPLFLVCAGQRLWCLDSTPVVKHSKPPERVWDLPLSAVFNITATKEPEFPAVRIWIERPGCFSRSRKTNMVSPSLRGGAADAELVVLGAQIGENVTKAIVVFHVDSHLKAKIVARILRPVIPLLQQLSSTSSTSLLPSPRSSPSAAFRSPRSSFAQNEDQQQLQPRRLGLAIGPLPSQMKKLAGPAHVGGAGVVLRVIPDSPASRGGLKEGDIVISCDGASLDVDNPLVTLKKAALKTPPSDIVLQVRRAPGGLLKRIVLGEE